MRRNTLREGVDVPTILHARDDPATICQGLGGKEKMNNEHKQLLEIRDFVDKHVVHLGTAVSLRVGVNTLSFDCKGCKSALHVPVKQESE